MSGKSKALSWRQIGIKALWVVGIALIMFIMTWIELYTRAGDKYAEAEALLEEAAQLTASADRETKTAKTELAIETYAEVISMHYAPFSPWVRKTQKKLRELGAGYEQQNNRRLALKVYREHEMAYPPLPYEAFTELRQELRTRIEALSAN